MEEIYSKAYNFMKIDRKEMKTLKIFLKTKKKENFQISKIKSSRNFPNSPQKSSSNLLVISKNSPQKSS